jgi:hypothetical protein
MFMLIASSCALLSRGLAGKHRNVVDMVLPSINDEGYPLSVVCVYEVFLSWGQCGLIHLHSYCKLGVTDNWLEGSKGGCGYQIQLWLPNPPPFQYPPEFQGLPSFLTPLLSSRGTASPPLLQGSLKGYSLPSLEVPSFFKGVQPPLLRSSFLLQGGTASPPNKFLHSSRGYSLPS